MTGGRGWGWRRGRGDRGRGVVVDDQLASKGGWKEGGS